MSAWMITDDHADFIAAAYVQLIDPAADPDTIGRGLLHENMRSLSARYGEQVDWDHLNAYRFRPWPGTLDAAWVNNAAACAGYQCSEHDEWRDSASCAHVIALLAATGGEEADVTDAPWGIEARHREAARVAPVISRMVETVADAAVIATDLFSHAGMR